MRLKQLEIKGFKSFADETVINFNQNVIGIVGPNGSGKSNIVDAIRWVLGEQKSRELRLDQMSSVIFNGTKDRKPGGVAHVSLTFENTKNLLPTEYHTVTISRLLYRTGESEYQLNGVTCRLKDITSLLLDTGIGSNSYAIIALGMVDDILSDKENSRRRMFEQAAGISKYKVRKKETLNKLKNTSADLDRVEDLLFEIESNLKTLEKQARRTKRYFQLKEKYKERSIDLAQIRIADLKQRHEELQKKLEQEQDRYRELESTADKLEAQLEKEKKENIDKERALSERQRKLNQLVGDIREMENQRQMMRQRSEFVAQNQKKLQKEIEAAEERELRLEAEIIDHRTRLNEEKSREETLEKELETAEGKLQEVREKHSSLKSDLQGIVQSQQTLEKALFELEKQRAINRNQMANYLQEKEQLEADIRQRRESASTLRQELAKLEEEEKMLAESLQGLEKAEEQRREELEKAEAALQDLNQKIARVNRELDAKRNEYQLTKSMVENLEGFPESIRFLSNNKNWSKEAPLLSDLIYVEEEYRIAIENYLEPYLNYYVVENIQQAYEAIQLLSKSQKGKANFFLLDAFEDYDPPMALLPDTTRAVDLIETEPAYQNLCNYLLENVLVTDRDEISQPLPDNNFILLSQSGRFIKRPFSLSGGSIGLFEGKKIGRKKNLEILDADIRKAEKKEDKLSSEFYRQKTRIESLKTRGTQIEIEEHKETLNRLKQEKV
ncbi:MAG: chromosome segregation protein SMC, partial [Saprospiraceae bacterium]|nr:chromosome segregation protein SMC [Saprospiraceae bacterium]